MNQFLVEKSQVKVKTRPNGKKFLEMRNPEYTCPLCRGGFFHPEEPRRISDEWLKTWSNAIHDINGEVVEEENKVDQINKFNRELMDFM
jgi:GTP1/Obg family GTP-binding protein